jgi:hypothetical protein
LTLEARMKGENLYGLFKVSDPGVASFLEENLTGLKERLSGLGFDPQLNVSVETPEESSRNLLSEMGAVNSLLNIVI